MAFSATVLFSRASAGLATVFRGSLNRDRLAQMLQLPPTKFVTCSQTVGYPKG